VRVVYVLVCGVPSESRPGTWNTKKKQLTEGRRWVFPIRIWGRDQDARCSSQIIEQVMKEKYSRIAVIIFTSVSQKCPD